MLVVENLRIAYGPRVLLDDVSFRLQDGEKVALVAPNGAGKTTLLRTLGGQRLPDAGKITRPETWAWLQQELPSDDYPKDMLALEVLLSASPLHELSAQIHADQKLLEHGADLTPDEMETIVHRFSENEETYRHGGGYELESNAERIAHGVGLTDGELYEDARNLSGGQRRRLELARLLLKGGELLVLDEPTNHLDVDAKKWVMEFIGTTQSTVLVVSHDIELMDKSVDRVIAIENSKIESYRGSYSSFLTQREEREGQAAREVRNRDKEVERLQKTMKMFAGANATHAAKRRQIQGHLDAVNKKFGAVDLKPKRRNIKVKFPDPIRSGDMVLEATKLTKSFDDHKVWNGINLNVVRGDRWLILGRNGAGKTTLLRTIAGLYTPDDGELRFGANVDVGFYAQEHEDLRREDSVFSHLEEVGGGIADSALRSFIGHFGLVGEVAHQNAGSLSGGEKTKLLLARLILKRSNFLLLDEPTNNLDPPSREAVLSALQHYKGTFICVTHDTDFAIQIAPNHVLVLPEGQLMPFDETILETIELR